MIGYKIWSYSQFRTYCYTRYRVRNLKTGFLAAHRNFRLMLLGSPPDMVRELRLRKTHLSTASDTSCRTAAALIMTSHPCYSGLQVQGTANSPASMTIFHIQSSIHVILTQSHTNFKTFDEVIYTTIERMREASRNKSERSFCFLVEFFKHIFDKYSITLSRIVYKNMGNRTNKFTVLYYWAAAHTLNDTTRFS